MLSLYQMQGKVVSTGRLTSWTATLPDWTGANVPGAVPVTDIVWSGGGFDLSGGGSSVPDKTITLNDGSYVVFTDGSYAVTT